MTYFTPARSNFTRNKRTTTWPVISSSQSHTCLKANVQTRKRRSQKTERRERRRKVADEIFFCLFASVNAVVMKNWCSLPNCLVSRLRSFRLSICSTWGRGRERLAVRRDELTLSAAACQTRHVLFKSKLPIFLYLCLLHLSFVLFTPTHSLGWLTLASDAS